MKKRFFGILLMGAMVVASMSTFTSCKDYDDDIKNQQEQIDALSKQISEIQNLIKNGGVIKTVTSIDNGVLITASNGDTFTVTNGVAGQNGKDGKDGTAWTIGTDGFWYQNGEKTEYYALGTTAASTTTTVIEASPKYYVPNATTGFFDIYQDGVKIESTTISFLGTGAITATMDENFLTLYGIAGALGPNNSVSISLNGALSSLVWKNELTKKYPVEKEWVGFLDGIETIEYPWIGDSTLVKNADYGWTQTTHHLKTFKKNGAIYDYLPNKLAHNPKSPIPTRKVYIYAPVWPVEYHLNPSNASVSFAESAPQFNVLEPNVNYYNTRTVGDKHALKVTSPEKYGFYTTDQNVWDNTDGVLTVGLKIANPQYLEPRPTDYTINPDVIDAATIDAYNPTYNKNWGFRNWLGWYNKYNTNADDKDTDYTIALQLNDGTGNTITSDYTLIAPSRIQLEALIWAKKPHYVEPYFGPGNQTGDEEGWVDAAQVHVWDSPEEALDDPRGAALELAVEDGTIDLKDYLGIHYIKENFGDRSFSVKTLKAKTFEEEQWGLHYEFELVDYEVSGNVSRDSRYVSFTDTELKAAEKKLISKNGVVKVLNVNDLKETIGDGSTTSVGREPLVRVLVKNAAGDVLLDGYILIHITTTPKNLIVDNYPDATINFDLCNAGDLKTDWAQFSYYVLTQKMDNYQKEAWDKFYYADCYDSDVTPSVAPDDEGLVSPDARCIDQTIDGNRVYSMKIFNFGDKNPDERGACNDKLEAEKTKLGFVSYYPNHNNTTNHRFTWTLTAEELETLTHHAKTFPVTVTRWIRFKAKDYTAGLNVDVDNVKAPYPYVWVKLTVNINRKNDMLYYTEKIDNYWYHFNTGASNGWSGTLLDIEAPRNGVSTYNQTWITPLAQTLKGNKIVLKNEAKTASVNKAAKYFFAPKDYSITYKPAYGASRTYRITAQKDLGDVNRYKTIYCLYSGDKIIHYTDYISGKNITKTNATDGVKHEFNPNFGSWNYDQTVKDVLYSCAIDYNAGAFNNYVLYAWKTGDTKGTPIARIIQPGEQTATGGNAAAAGQIELIHWLDAAGNPSQNPADKENVYAYECLNAIGYINGEKISNENINEQLRAWVGVIANNGCDVAEYVEQDLKDDEAHKATFLASWERPINMEKLPIEVALDANTKENIFYLVDYLKLFDWRGPASMGKQGYMYGDHQWFWAYYNVRAITVDLNPAHVTTNMHQSDPTKFVALNSITSMLNLFNIRVKNEGTATAEVEIDGTQVKRYPNGPYDYATNSVAANRDGWALPTNAQKFTYSTNNDALIAYMGITPVKAVNKARFGGFYYANNGSNVDEFSLRIPVKVEYEWGYFEDVVEWKIQTTHGN